MTGLSTVKIKELIETNQVMTTDYMVLEKDTGTYKCQARYLKGATGPTPEIKVGDTTTLPVGQNATVTQRGSVDVPIFDFGIPQGPQGPIGPQGPPGSASIAIDDTTQDTTHAWSGAKVNNFVEYKLNTMEDVKGLVYITDSDYKLLTGTKNGVIKDLKLKGKTLVNYFGINKINKNNVVQYATLADSILKVENGKKYTIKIKSNADIDIKYKENNNLIKSLISSEGEISYLFISNVNSYISLISSAQTGTNFDVDVTLLEGDYTQNPPQYFEGMKSVGDDVGQIDVLTSNSLLTLSDETVEGGKKINDTYIFENITNIDTNKIRFDDIKVIENNVQYVLGYDILNKSNFDIETSTGYDITGSFWSNITVNANTKKRIYKKFTSSYNYGKRLLIGVSTPNSSFEISNITLSKSENNIDLKKDKKTFLYKDALDNTIKKITKLTAYDYTTDDGYYINQSNFLTITGNETNIEVYPQTGFTQFNIPLQVDKQPFSKITCISNLFNTYETLDKEGIQTNPVGNGLIVVWIDNTKLISQDLNGLKDFCTKNNFEVVYKTVNQIQYKLTPNELNSFESETLYMVNSGFISPTSEFYVDSNIGSVLLDTINRVEVLENNVFAVNKAILAGDFRTAAEILYPNDFVNDVSQTPEVLI